MDNISNGGIGTNDLDSLKLTPQTPAQKALNAALVRTAKRMAEERIQKNWGRVLVDAAFFIDTFCQIDNPQGDGLEIMPFHLWADQRRIIEEFEVYNLITILKARQLGISWLCCAYVLWLCLMRKGKVVLLFSKGQLEANELARRVSVMYARLPEFIKGHIKLVKDNTGELVWSNGSRVQSLAATRSAGRSFTASLVIVDEFGFVQYAEEVYTALKPTIDAGGKLFLVSTANGEEGTFYDIWKQSEQKLNRFHPIFLSWRSRPDRDDEWYARVEAESLNAKSTLSEYPSTAADAFQSTGSERFLPSMASWDNCKEEIPELDTRVPLVLAADGAVSKDMFAVVVTSKHPTRPDTVSVRWAKTWIPDGKYDLDMDEIEKEILTFIQDHNVMLVTHDPAQIAQMMQHLAKHVWVRKFPQGLPRLIADNQLLDLILQRRIAHDGNTDLRDAINNADRQVDPNERKLRIIKRSAEKKIDAAVALSMACAPILDPHLNFGD